MLEPSGRLQMSLLAKLFRLLVKWPELVPLVGSILSDLFTAKNKNEALERAKRLAIVAAAQKFIRS